MKNCALQFRVPSVSMVFLFVSHNFTRHFLFPLCKAFIQNMLFVFLKILIKCKNGTQIGLHICVKSHKPNYLSLHDVEMEGGW